MAERLANRFRCSTGSRTMVIIALNVASTLSLDMDLILALKIVSTLGLDMGLILALKIVSTLGLDTTAIFRALRKSCATR